MTCAICAPSLLRLSVPHSTIAMLSGNLAPSPICRASSWSACAVPWIHANLLGMRNGSKPWILRPVGSTSRFFRMSPPGAGGTKAPFSACINAPSSSLASSRVSISARCRSGDAPIMASTRPSRSSVDIVLPNTCRPCGMSSRSSSYKRPERSVRSPVSISSSTQWSRTSVSRSRRSSPSPEIAR